MRTRKFNALNDILFKFIFGHRENKGITLSFINALNFLVRMTYSPHCNISIPCSSAILRTTVSGSFTICATNKTEVPVRSIFIAAWAVVS